MYLRAGPLLSLRARRGSRSAANNFMVVLAVLPASVGFAPFDAGWVWEAGASGGSSLGLGVASHGDAVTGGFTQICVATDLGQS
jgi:hypothetical protein